MLERQVELVNRVQVFAHCQRYAGRVGDARIAFVVVRNGRLLEPEDVEGLEALARNDGLVHAHGVVGIHHQGNVRADQLPHCANALDVFVEVLASDFYLDSVDALGEVTTHVAKQFLERKGQINTAAVGLAGVPGAAGQLPEWLLGFLATDIPKRDVHGLDRE